MPATLLHTLVESAVRAPSSHNTQPWVFRLAGDRLELHADRTRALAVNDPHDRELTMSCAAAWFNVRVAAAAAGTGLASEILPDGEASDLLVRAAVTAGGAAEDGLPPVETVAARRTYRKDFDEREIPGAVAWDLACAAEAEGAAFTVVGDEQRSELVALIGEGDRRQFADVRWRRELAAWMHPRRAGDGLLVPDLAAPATRFVVAHVDLGRRMAGKDAQLAERSPVLALLSTAADGVRDWLAAGQALQRVLLTACAAGVQASYLNQPIQVEGLRPLVTDLLPAGGVPQLLLRLGYPRDDLVPAPRRDLAAVIED